MKVSGASGYFHASRRWHPEVDEDLARWVADEPEHWVFDLDNPEERLVAWRYSRDLDWWVKVIIQADEMLLFNGYVEDPGFVPFWRPERR